MKELTQQELENQLNSNSGSQTWGTLRIDWKLVYGAQQINVNFFLENELCDLTTLSAAQSEHEFNILLGNSKADGKVAATFATEHGGVAETLRGDFEYCQRQYIDQEWNCRPYAGIITNWPIWSTAKGVDNRC